MPALRKVKQPTILNSEGKPIKLNQWETAHASYMQKILNEKLSMIPNSLGYEIPITTLTTIMKKVTEQTFFQVPPADYVPVRVGEGAFSSQLTTFRSFDLAAPFEDGIINTGTNNSRLAQADVGVDALNIQVKNWAKGIGWNIIDLQQAVRAGNWDLVTAKEKARKKNWDLGIQAVAFLGIEGDPAVLGLLNQSGITNDTSTIPKPISSMSTAELKTFAMKIVEAYRANCARTAWPTHFILPETDFNGLASSASPDFPIKSTLELLKETFETITQNKNFKILPLAYGDAAFNSLGVQRYVMLNYDEESIRCDVPVMYTNTLANSLDNFNFQNVAYGQFTGVLAYRPLELLYFSHTL